MPKKINPSIKGKIALSDPEVPLWTGKIPKSLLDRMDNTRIKMGYNKRTVVMKAYELYLLHMETV
jgi:hypothetical protein